MASIPKHLESTYQMIANAFPDGIKEDQYFPLLALLYDFMSDRSLAEVISLYTQKDYSIVLNDVYKAASEKPRDSEIQKIRSLLLLYGFDI